VIRKPFDGVFRLQQQMEWKNAIIARLTTDWIIHLDDDEILQSPREGESLRDMIERLDAEGFDVINCDEFMFVPVSESDKHAPDSFLDTMRHYYLFAPNGLTNHRIYRKSSGMPEWQQSGGHALDLSQRRLAPEKCRKRHYVGLSLDKLRSKYLSRVFDGEELRKGWHLNRVATSVDFIVPPPRDRLFHLDTDEWHTDRPEAKHLIFREPYAYVPPKPVIETAHPPMPFVVGTGRSGTTLLRMLLDAHPDLAIPPETQWLPDAINALDRHPGDAAALRKALTQVHQWWDMGIEDEALEDILRQHDGTKPFKTLRTFYQVYASRFGATRAGDKTPLHGLQMHKITRAFPDAHFIHVIRDGRDVALSYRNTWFAPARDVKGMAKFWIWGIREMRQQAQFLPHYMEVRYEQLVTETEQVLRQICDFIRLPFHPAQLQAHALAGVRLSELKDAQRKDGLFLPKEKRLSVFTETQKPPHTERIARWRKEMSASEMADFNAIAGNMLAELGYR
jgi:hypothetical protein